MGPRVIPRCITALLFTIVFLLGAPARPSEAAFNRGAETCQQCHTSEYQVWSGTKHFASFREVHKNPLAKEVLAAVGGSPNMKANDTCVLCHYTMVQETADAKPVAKSGPSCESCHGASSDWVTVHNDYGGPSVKKEDETPEHKAKRIADAHAAGWREPSMTYELAFNCMSCHGLANPALNGDTVSKMLDAGHPLKPEWEFVRYSQGTVRHRFYPPDTSVNAEMTPAELARAFVTGQAAKLVSAAGAKGKSRHPTYQAGQDARASQAREALAAIKSVPEAGALAATPTEGNARKLVAAIADKDLTGEVGHLLPDPSTTK